MMFAADDTALSECEESLRFARVSERLKRYNAVDSEVLYPPLGERVTYDPGTVGDTIVYVSRVVPHKRQLLAVEALALTRTPVKLTIAGRSEDGSPYAEEIYQTTSPIESDG